MHCASPPTALEAARKHRTCTTTSNATAATAAKKERAGDGAGGSGEHVTLLERAPHELVGCQVRVSFGSLGEQVGVIRGWHLETGNGRFRVMD